MNPRQRQILTTATAIALIGWLVASFIQSDPETDTVASPPAEAILAAQREAEASNQQPEMSVAPVVHRDEAAELALRKAGQANLVENVEAAEQTEESLNAQQIAAARKRLEQSNPTREELQNPEGRAAAVKRIKAAEDAHREAVLARAKMKGLDIEGVREDGVEFALVDFDEDGQPVYLQTENVNAAITTAADQVREVAAYNSVDGSSVIVGIWENGVPRTTHQEFGGRVTVQDGSSTVSDHATHVAGTMAAAGVDANAKGMAPAANVYAFNLSSYQSEFTEHGATAPNQTKIYVSNHSYGVGQGWEGTTFMGTFVDDGNPATNYEEDFGQYTTSSRTWDELAFAMPYHQLFISSGNHRSQGPPSNGSTWTHWGIDRAYDPSQHPLGDGDYKGGWDNMEGRKLSKNSIVVGNAQDAVTGGVRDLSKAITVSSSSRGPADDGRIKPDITANGSGVYSAEDASDTDYGDKTGTSMSTPSVCGSAALLVDYYSSRFPGGAMRASTLKALILHTADDDGNPGPDYRYGWGIMNTKTAADLIKAHADNAAGGAILESSVNDTTTTSRTHNFNWDGNSPLRVTLCWTDPAGTVKDGHDNREKALINDLNVKVTGPGGTHLPYVMPHVGNWSQASIDDNATTGVNDVDNVEQVYLATPGAGEYTITVDYVGSLENNAQDYSLIVSGQISSAAEIEVEYDGPPVAALTDDSGTQNFGTAALSAAAVVRNYTIRNTGGTDLTGLALSKSGSHAGDYTLGALSATDLATGETATFTITYDALAVGTRTATVQIASSDADENPFDIHLTAVANPDPANITWDGSESTAWETPANWDLDRLPITQDVVYINSGDVELSTASGFNLKAMRTLGGTVIFSGGTFNAGANASWASRIDGTLNHTGTTGSFNALEVGRTSGKTAFYYLSGGSLTIVRGRGGYSLHLGANESNGNAGTGTFEMTRGSIISRVGVKLGDATSTGTGNFHVLGSAMSQIGIGASGSLDGTWMQHSGSTLKAGIDLGGMRTIVIHDLGGTGTSATFENGSLLDVGYYDNGSGGGTWTVLEVQNGDVTDNGLAFAPGVDTGVWSFNVDNSGANGKLTVTASGDPITGHVYWEGNESSAWETGANWNNGVGPVDGDYAYLRFGTTDFTSSSGTSVNMRGLRVEQGTLNITGGEFKANFQSSAETHLNGTVTQSGGTADINEVEIGNGSGDTGSLVISGGEFKIGRAKNGNSLYLGANRTFSDAGTGSITISGGRFTTRAGVKLGDATKTGTGSFTVLGGDIAQIGISGANTDSDGTWLQSAGSTLKVGIALGGVRTIFLHDGTNPDVTSATFENGSLLDVDYYDDGSGGGTWTVMEVENGDVIDNGLAFAPGVDTDLWSFSVDNSGANGKLLVTAVGDPTGIALTVSNTKKQQLRYGIDYERLWYWTTSLNAAEKDEVAKWSVVDADVDFVRVAMNSKYELVEGTLDLSAYTQKIIPMMQDMRDANPDIKFFASPRPLNEAVSGAAWQPYPQWVTGSTGNNSNFNFDWQKCAEYLVKYILLMKSYGFDIEYMDYSNEWNYLTPSHARDILAYLEANLDAEDVPLMIAPSTWSYAQGVSWVNSVNTTAKKNAIHIASSHNTDKTGTALDFFNKAAETWTVPNVVDWTTPGEVEVWNTELHGWKSTSGQDEALTSSFMFETIRAGFHGISGWLAIGTKNQGHSFILNPSGTATPNVKYWIFKKITSTSNRGYQLDINQPNELKIAAATIRGDLMTVWVINESASNVPIIINPTDRTYSESRVKRTRFSTAIDVEGISDHVSVLSDTSVWSILEPESVYSFEILLDPEGPQFTRIEAENFDEKSGMGTEATGDVDGNLNLSNMDHDNWSRYDNITLGPDSVMRFRAARPSGRPDGWIEARIGSPTGTLLGKVAVPETGGWQVYETIEAKFAPVVGTHSIYLTYKEVGSTAGSALFNLNWFSVSSPVPPTGLAGTSISGSRIDLTWNAVPGAVSYNLKRSANQGGPYTIVGSALATTSYSDTGVAPSTPYYYVVSTVYSDVESPDSSEITVLRSPAAPTGLTATTISDTQIDLAWNAVTGATSYNLKRSLTQGGAYTTVATGLTGTSTSDTGLTAGTHYYYVLSAENGSGEGVNSAEADAITKPAAPTGLAATTISAAQIDLTWNAVTGAATYNLKRATTQGGPYTTVASGLTGTSTSDSSLSAGTHYYYVLSAENTGGEGVDSAEADALTLPAGPTGLTATTISDTQIDLAWNAVTGATTYKLKRSITPGGPYTPVATGLTGTSTSDTGLTAGTHYYYVLSAENSSGEGVDSTEADAFTIPVAPTGLAATAISASQIDLTWNAVSGASSYNLKRSTTPGGPYVQVATGLTGTSTSDSGLAGGTQYYYVLSAVNLGGESVDSAEAGTITFPSGTGGLQLGRTATIPAIGSNTADGRGISQIVASSLVGAVGEKVASTTAATGVAHLFTVGAGQVWVADFFAFKVNAGRMGNSTLKIIRYDQGPTTDAAYATVMVEHVYGGPEIATTAGDYLYYEFDPITFTGGKSGTLYALAFENQVTSVELKALLDITDPYADGALGRGFHPAITSSGRDFNFALGNTLGAEAKTVVFAADFDASAEISGAVTANATAANLDAGTSVGTWSLPGVEPGAIISDGVADNAFLFDRALSTVDDNAVSGVFSRSVDLAAGEALTLELDLYAVRQSGGQRVWFSLDDATGNSAFNFVYLMNNEKSIHAINSSGNEVASSPNQLNFNNGFLNPTVDGYRTWGTGKMVHVKLEVASQPTQAGNRGARLSIDWNGDGDYADTSEVMDIPIGPRLSGVTKISSLRIYNESNAGGVWLDNVTVTAQPGDVFASSDHHNLARFQAILGDSSLSDNPGLYATDGYMGQDSRWVSDDTGPHTLRVTMASPMTIGSVHIFTGDRHFNPISNFSLQHKVDSTWTDIPGTVVSGNSSVELNLTFDTPVTANQFRLYSTDTQCRVKEMALYPPTADGSIVPFGTDLDLNIAKLRQITATTTDGANYPKLAADGYADDSSSWVSDNSAGPHDLEILLIQNEQIRGIHLYSGLTGQPGTEMKNFEVAFHNGSSWVTFNGGTISNNDQLDRAIRFGASANTSRIRIRALDSGAARIREVVVLPENNGAGYPLYTDVKCEPAPSESFLDYDDSYYAIKNRPTGHSLVTSPTSSTVANVSDSWFQILLNIGTDTYRLRSQASSACFEVLDASTVSGAAIVEGSYSSMPHQNWRLVDTGDGTHYRIINVWSGMALERVGDDVVQTAVNANATQEWRLPQQAHYPKKGAASYFHYTFMTQPSWGYKWDTGSENDLATGQYMPMKWGGFNASSGLQKNYVKWYARPNQTTLLGFNEPDKHDQANMTELRAADEWPRMERMRLPLGGPVPAAANGSWRQNYEAMATERGHRAEYMTMHWYAGCNNGDPSNIINAMQNVYNVYGKPIWLTEFAVKDWSGTSTAWNRNQNYNWLAEFMWRAEGIDWLKKYAVFIWDVGDNNADPNVNDAPTMGLTIRNDKVDPGFEDLSELGKLYAAWDGDANVRTNKAYIIHNKGRYLRLRNNPGSGTAEHGDIFGSGPWMQWALVEAPNNLKYIVGLNDGRRLSYNGSSVGLAAKHSTGSQVEWDLTEHQHGWFYISHAASGKRLRITDGDVINMDTAGAAYDNVRWRFILPEEPIYTSGPGVPAPVANVGNNAITLQWSAVTGWSPTYTISRSLSPGGPFAELAADETGTSYADTTVVGGTTYYYQVTAIDCAGVPSASSVTVSGTVLASPTGLTATTFSTTQIDLTWNVVASATSYNLKRSTVPGGPYTTILTGLTGTSASDTGLTAGTRYYYVLSAENSNGEGLDSAEADAITIPLGPTGLTATASSAAQIDLTWNAVTGAASYDLKRSTTPGGAYTTVSSGLTATSTSDTGLTAGTVYYYVLSAVNEGGESSDSSEADALTFPAGPTGLAATAVSTSQIDLLWDAVPSATSYTLWRSSMPSGPYTTVASGLTSTGSSDTGLSVGTAYYYVLSAVNGSGESVTSVEAGAITIPSSPTGLIATIASASEVNLAWNAVAGATSYTLKRSLTPGGTYTIVSSGLTSPSHGDTGLAASTQYYYVVSAVNSGGESIDSTEVGAVTKPANPTGLSVTSISVSQLDVSWTPVSGATSYNLKRSTSPGGPYTTVGSGSAATSVNDTGLSAGTLYYYVVSAVNSSGESIDSSEVGAVTIPISPTGVTATPMSAARIDLTWNAVSSATHYDLKRATAPGGPYVVVGSGVTETSAGDTGLSAGTIYYYVVSAFNSGGESIDSAEVNALTQPASPTGLTGTAASISQIDLSWSAVASATSYNLKRSTSPGGPYSMVGGALTSTSASDTGLSGGINYYYVLSAVNSSGESVDSAEVGVLTKPASPSGLAATAASDTQIDLTWSAVASATGYNLKRASTPGGPYTTVGSALTATSMSDTGLAAGTGYYYVVSAVNSSGEGSASSEAGVSTKTASPTGLAATAVNASQVDLSWSAVAGATSYNLKRSSIQGGPYATISSGLTSLSHSDSGRSAGTQYYYVLSAVNSGGESVDSAEVGALTMPAGPSGLTATAVSISQIDLTWSAVTGAASYNLKRSSIPGGPYATVASGLTSTGTSDTGLSAGTHYYYVLSAVNGSGEGVDSSEVSALTKPAGPGGLTATSVSDTQIDLAWSAVTGAASYDLKRSNSPGGPFTTVASGLTSTSASDTGLSASTQYYYVVSAVNPSGAGDDSVVAGAVTKPAIPAGLTATSANATQIDLTWSSVAGATSYNLKRSATSGGPYTTVAIGLTSTSTSDTERSAGTQYYYVVSAVNSGGESVDSGEAGALTHPAIPTGLSATAASASRIDLSWSAVFGAASYDLKRSDTPGGPYTTVVTGLTSTSTSDAGRSAGTQYYYVISAVNSGGASADSGEASALTKPSGPSGVAATTASASQIDLTWSAVSGATSYNLKRSTTLGGPYVTVVGGLTSTSRNDNGLSAGTIYYYVVSAVNSSGEGVDSSEVNGLTKPAIPSGLAAAVTSSSQINLSWNSVIGAASYTLKRSTSPGGPYTTVSSASSAVNFSDSGLLAGTQYHYIVSAVNSGGESGDSAEISAFTKPSSAIGLIATTVSDTKIDLSWSAVSGATSYELKRSTTSGGPYATVSSGLTDLNFSDTGRTAGTQYYYVLIAVYPNLDTLESSEASAFTTPVSPTGLTAAPVSASQVDLSWSSVSGATSYNLKRSTTQGGPYVIVASGLSATSYSDTGRSAGTQFYYVLSAVNPGGESSDSSEAGALTKPASPSGLTIAAASASQFDLSWSSVSGAASYNLKRSTAQVGPFTTVGSGVTATSASDTGLSAGTRYYYVVSAVNSSGESVDSSVVGEFTKPSSPSGLTATTVSETQIDLSWATVTGASSYVLKRSTTQGGPYTSVGSGVTGISTSDTGRIAGTQYFYVVSAVNGSGESVDSAEIGAFTKPGSPTGLVAAAASDTQIDLSWSSVTGASSYNLKRSATQGGPYTTVGSGLTTANYSDTGRSAGTEYFYVVNAVNSGGESVDSSEVSGFTKPGSPIGLAATTASDSQIDLSWSAVTSATSYNVKRSTTQGGPYTTVGNGLTALNFSDIGRSAGVQYFYVISAVNDGGEGVDSAEVEAFTKPAIPTGLVATAANDTQIDLAWDSVTGASGYNLKRSSTPGGPYATVGTELASTSYSDTGLSDGVQYFYVVSAVNSGGESVDSAEVSEFTSPASPTGLTANIVSASQVDLSWSAVSSATSYTLKRSTTPGGPYSTVSSGLTSVSFGDTGLSAGTQFHYVVSAVNSGGESVDSTEVAALTKPASPLGLTAVAASVSQIDLTWDTVSGATSYNLKRSATPGGPYTTVVGGATTTSANDTGLSIGTRYHYVVSAVNSSGESVDSIEVSEFTKPAGPAGLAATAASDTQIDLFWNAVSGASSYNLKRASASGGPFTTVSIGLTTTSTSDTGLTAGTQYHYVVSAANSGGESVDSSAVGVFTKPAGPTGLAATAADDTQIDLTWNSVSGATSYILKRSTTLGGPYPAVASGLTSASYSDTGRSAGTHYYYVVSAVNSSGESIDSSEVGALTKPARPTGLLANADSASQVDLTWNAVFGAASYNLKRSASAGGPYTTVGSGLTSTGTSDSGLSSGTHYYYVLSALNSSGESVDSSEVAVLTKPASPTGFAATTVSATEIDLSWNAVDGATSYHLKRGISPGGPYLLVGSGLTSTTHSDTRLLGGVHYYYVLSAVNDSGEGINSSEVDVYTKPAQPLGLSGTAASDSQIDLSWSATSGADSYSVKRSTSPGGPYTTVATGVNTTTASDPGRTAGTRYYYVLSAVNTGGESVDSAEISVLTKPTNPSGLTATSVSESQIDLSWSVVPGATSYDLKRASNSGGPYTTVRSGLTSTSTSDTGLSVGTRYYYVISSVNSSGAGVDSTEVSEWTKPASPISVGVNVASESQIDLSWNAVTSATSYRLKRSETPGGPYTTVENGVTEVSISDTNLTAGTLYYYVVSAVNGGGESTDSAEVSGLTKPAGPAGLSLAASSASQINLTWDPVPGATSYNLKRSATLGGPYTTLVSGVIVTGRSDTGLSAGTVYHYVVSAVNSSGESVDSAPASGVTRPAGPAGLIATAVSSSQIDLSWSVVPGASSYTLKRSATSGGVYTTVASGLASLNFSDPGRSAGTLYYYVISAVNGGGESAHSAEVGGLTKPANPTGLAATPASAVQIDLSWNSVPGATSYTLKRSTTPGGPYTTVRNGMASTSTSDTGLSAGTHYYYVASAANSSGESTDSPEVGVFTKPGSLTGLTATTASETQIDLAWNSVPSATSYNLKRATTSGGPYTTVASQVASTSTSDIGLSAGIQYYYVVSAVNGGGEGVDSAEVGAITKPDGPTGLTATSASASQIDLSWSAVVGAASYDLKRSTTQGGPYTTVASGLTSTSTGDIGLLAGTQYHYVISAVNTGGASVDSAEASAWTKPESPLGLAAVAASASQVDLSWSAVSSATSYNLKRSTTPGGPYVTMGSGLTSTDTSDAALSAGTGYYYVVSAVNLGGESVDSPEVGVFTKPDSLAGLTATTVSDTQIDLAWNSVSGATSYNLKRSTSQGGPYSTVGSGLTSTEMSDAGLTAGTRYYYVISAVNNSGESTDSSEVSALTIPAPPIGLAAATVSETQIDLSWPAVTGAASYTLKRSITPGGPYTVVDSALTTTDASDTGLSAGLRYYYVMSAVNSGGESIDSAEVGMRTKPANPTGLTAVAVSASQVDLSWSAVIGAASYDLKRSSIPGGPYTTVASGVAATSTSDSGLSAGTNYYYVVIAVNTGGESVDSAEVSVLTKPASPADLTAISTSASQLDLSWSAVNSATSYTLKRSAALAGPYITIGSALTSTNMSDTGLLAGTRYYYVVGAVNSSGESVDSTAVDQITRPARPSGMSATVLSDGRIVLTWGAVSGATSYQLKRSASSGGPYTNVGGAVTSTSTSDTGLSAGSRYFYVISALNSGGEGADSVKVSVLTKPASPTGLTATVASVSQIDLSWDAVAGGLGYHLKRSTTPGGPYVTVGYGLPVTSMSDTGLTLGTRYYYVVSAVTIGGESLDSAPVSAVPSDPIVPADLAIGSMTISADGAGGRTMTLSIQNSGMGHSYQVVAAPSLRSPTWQNASAVFQGNGGPLALEMPFNPSVAPQRFYRVKAWVE